MTSINLPISNQNYINKINQELKLVSPETIKRYPVGEWLDRIESYNPLKNYNTFDEKITKAISHIESHDGQNALSLYNQLILIEAMKRTLNSKDLAFAPPPIQKLFIDWFSKILEQIDQSTEDYYSYDNDAYLKDLGVCTQRLIPIGGAWVVEISGISRKFLFKLSPRNWYDNIYFFLKLKGFKPFYQIHAVLSLTDRFNEHERENAYLNIALLLAKNKHIKGMFASSWLNDPQLAIVSPRLAYLVKTPEANGARCFFVGASKSDTNGALLKSPTRRKLFAKGEYIPTVYVNIWYRQDLINWAKKHSGELNV